MSRSVPPLKFKLIFLFQDDKVIELCRNKLKLVIFKLNQADKTVGAWVGVNRLTTTTSKCEFEVYPLYCFQMASIYLFFITFAIFRCLQLIIEQDDYIKI